MALVMGDREANNESENVNVSVWMRTKREDVKKRCEGWFRTW